MTYNLFNADLIENLYYLKVKYYEDFYFGDKILYTPLTAQKNEEILNAKLHFWSVPVLGYESL